MKLFAHRGRLASLAMLVAIGLPLGCAPLFPPPDTTAPDSAATIAPLGNFSRLDNTARFLAGMPGGGNARLTSLRQTAGWQSHAKRMDQLFGYFDRGYLPRVREFRTELGALTATNILFYPFGGPDYLYANGFFPGANHTVLVGLEGVDALPDFETLSEAEIQQGLAGLSKSLRDITGASYFITKDMRADLESTAFKGTLPIILVMIARSGQSIQSVTPVGIGSSGELTSRSAGAASPGWHIVAGGKHIYYFREDLSNGTLGSDRRLLSFVKSKGAPVTFVKSASYLMHSDGFSRIRDFVLNDSRAILQDASGVPYRYLNEGDLQLTLYGNYTEPLSVFSERHQADLAQAYRTGFPHTVKPIEFGVGYLRNPANACLILARQ